MTTSVSLKNNIQLLQSYYRFLSLGKYLEFLIQSKDFSKDILDIAIVTGERSHFGIKAPLIKTLLKQIHTHPDQKNIFGYLVEISSFRGIFSIMRELVDGNEVFQKFAFARLNTHYFAFEQIIRLVRNVLSHTMTSDLSLKTEDFIKQKDYLTHEKQPIIGLKFLYAPHRKEWKGGKEYGLDISVDFTQLKDGQTLFDIIPLHQLYLLSELCNNLCEIFRMMHFSKKEQKIVGKGTRKR